MINYIDKLAGLCETSSPIQRTVRSVLYADGKERCVTACRTLEYASHYWQAAKRDTCPPLHSLRPSTTRSHYIAEDKYNQQHVPQYLH